MPPNLTTDGQARVLAVTVTCDGVPWNPAAKGPEVSGRSMRQKQRHDYVIDPSEACFCPSSPGGLNDDAEG